MRPADLTVELPSGEHRMEYPLTLLGVVARAPAELVDPSISTPDFSVEVESVTADGTPVTGLDVLGERSNGSDLLRAGAPADLDAVPAIVTRAVADAARAEVGSTLSLTVAGRQLPLTVAGVVDSVPTARVPDRAVVVDLPTVLALGDGGAPSTRPVEPRSGGSTRCPCPPCGMPCAPGCRPGSPCAVRTDLVAERAANPVNAGMRAAMLLVTGAALVLAAVGFAATTAALGPHPPPRERRAARPRDAAGPDPPGARPRAGGGRRAHRRRRPGAGGAQRPRRRAGARRR